MSTKNILKPIDVNNTNMDRSPARKRARYGSESPPTKERWSLTRNDLKLDEVFDYGLGVLESDSETQTDDEKETSYTSCKEVPIDIIENIYNAKTSEERDIDLIGTINLDEWSDFLINKPSLNDPGKLSYFSILSDEVMLHIFHFLPKEHLMKVATVCRRWNCLSKDESLWARMDVSCKYIGPGALGQILSRQVVILRLAQSEIIHPIILPDCRADELDYESRLLYLDLSMVHIAVPSLLALFSKCKRLKKLSLEHVAVNNEVIEMVSTNKELEVLNLAMVSGLEVCGLKNLLNNCTKLRELNLSWTFLSMSAVKYVCANLPRSLDRLNIAGCRKLLNDDHVLDLVKRCRGLRELDLSDCTGLTGEAVTHITMLKELNFLALSRCYLITYKALLNLKKVDSLVYLDIHGGYIEASEMQIIQDTIGSNVHLNKFKFSSVARPTVGAKRSTIWNLRVRD